MKLAIVIIMILVTLIFDLFALGKTNKLGYWFLPLVVALLLIPTAYCIFKSLKAK